jgi:polar amino acid transport system substrate-binding protein
MKTFKKIPAIAMVAVLAVLAVGMLTGCAKTAEKGKKYLIATDTTFAPFEFQNAEGKFVGIDMEILAEIAKDQKFEYELQVVGFNAAVQSLEAKQSDGVIAGMSITDARKEKFDFSEPYFDSGVVMGIAAGNDAVKSYADLKGKKVAVKTGTEGATFAESIKDQYGFELAYFEDSANMYEDVKTGNSVACFEDYPVLGYGISQNVGLKIVTEKEKGSSYGFAVNKGVNTELLSKFNAGLANIKANGTYQAILDKYIKK